MCQKITANTPLCVPYQMHRHSTFPIARLDELEAYQTLAQQKYRTIVEGEKQERHPDE
jgi:hypothetical protein